MKFETTEKGRHFFLDIKKNDKNSLRKEDYRPVQWLTPVIPALWEAMVG